MEKFNISEIFQIAIRIEEEGKKFYTELSKNTKKENLKEFFEFMAQEEQKHKEFFEELAKSVADYSSVDNYPEEYFTYIRSYADNIIFSRDKKRTITYDINNIFSALDLAIQSEQEAIWYYSEIKPLIPEDKRCFIDDIISEERKHFKELSEIRHDMMV
ncbi:ferritin family protein [bacterium]